MYTFYSFSRGMFHSIYSVIAEKSEYTIRKDPTGSRRRERDETNKRRRFLIKFDIPFRAPFHISHTVRSLGSRKAASLGDINAVLSNLVLGSLLERAPRGRRGYRSREGFVSPRYGFHCLRGTCPPSCAGLAPDHPLLSAYSPRPRRSPARSRDRLSTREESLIFQSGSE